MSKFAPVRVAIIGCGMIAKKGYLPRCLHYKEKLEVVGVFDGDRARAEEFAKDGGGTVFRSLEELLCDKRIEAVVNLTTLDGHYPISLAALKAGKHVFSEKPISETTQQATELIETAAKNKLKLACGPSAPLGYDQQEAWKRVRGGAIGRPVSCVGNFSTQLDSWHPNADVFMNTGPGVVPDAATYPLTMMTTVLGPVKRVYGFAEITLPNRVIQQGPKKGKQFPITVVDHCLGLLEFESGAKGFIMTTWSGRSEVPAFEIVGTEGTLAVNPHNDGMGIKMIDRADNQLKTGPAHPKAFNNWLDWGKGVVDLADAIRNDRPVRCSGEHARHILEIAEKFNESTKLGRPVDLATRFPAPEPVGEVAPWE